VSHLQLRRAFTRQCLRPTFEWYRKLVAASKLDTLGAPRDAEACDWFADTDGGSGHHRTVGRQLLQALDLVDAANVAWDATGFNLTRLRLQCRARR